MLWSKESNQEDALYTNFVDPTGHLERVYQSNQMDIKIHTKNNELSLKYRKEGNDKFTSVLLQAAIECYNKSLCFAETGSVNVGLAYGNRSACFFHLKMYDKCLIDIDLALATNYPAEKLAKLEDRRSECLKIMETKIHQKELRLDFKPHDKYPEMASILQIKSNKEFGRYISTKSDIDVGQIILVEPAFVAHYASKSEKYRRCNICLRNYSNLVPCRGCPNALFCYTLCDNNNLHKCEIKICSDEDSNDIYMQTVRSILVAINTCLNVDELMNFVEQSIKIKPQEVPASLLDSKSKYRAYLKLSVSTHSEKQSKLHWEVYLIYRALLNDPEIKEMFASEKHRRFLMHLIGHHLVIEESNSECLTTIENDILCNGTRTQCIIARYFNHSCTPTIGSVNINNLMVYFAIRPIEKGEQLFVSYFGNDDGREMEGKDGLKAYFRFYNFSCKCLQCNHILSSSNESKRMKADPNYQYVAANYFEKLYTFDSVEEIKTLMKNCEEFLQKFGRQVWTKELGNVIICYSDLFRMQFE